MSAELDPFDLDQTVARAAQSAARGAESDDTESPLEFFRQVSGTRALDALVAMVPNAVEAPLREALRLWVTHLLIERLAHPIRLVERTAAREPTIVAPATDERVSWRQAWRELVAASEPRAAEWLARIADDGPRMASAVRETRTRLSELLARVEEKIAGHPGETWQKLGLPAPEATCCALAEALLAATDDVASELVREEKRRGTVVESGVTALVAGLARDAASAFPAKVRARWFSELFGAHLHGLRLSPPIPERVVGASTFARALASFGRALRNAVTASDLPFSLRASPRALDAERFGALFGALAGDRVFVRSKLGAAPTEAERARRAIAKTMLLTARTDAARILLARDERRFEELTSRVFGAPWPAGLAGAWPPVRAGDEGRLAGAIEALPLARQMVERFDEDWFKNPRAFEWIRARGAAPMSSFDVASLVIEGGPDALAREAVAHLEAALG